MKFLFHTVTNTHSSFKYWNIYQGDSNTFMCENLGEVSTTLEISISEAVGGSGFSEHNDDTLKQALVEALERNLLSNF